MAADIRADAQNAQDAPDEIKKLLIPEDDKEMQRANATAAQWMTETLGAASGDLVGVVVMWTHEPQLPGIASHDDTDQIVFVLVRGVQRENASPKIRGIIYGIPLAN
jgi:hypothetical protein